MSLELPRLNKGVSLAHFQSSANYSVVKEQLKIFQIEIKCKLNQHIHELVLQIFYRDRLLLIC